MLLNKSKANSLLWPFLIAPFTNFSSSFFIPTLFFISSKFICLDGRKWSKSWDNENYFTSFEIKTGEKSSDKYTFYVTVDRSYKDYLDYMKENGWYSTENLIFLDKDKKFILSINPRFISNYSDIEYYIFDTVKAYLSYVIYCDAPSLNLIFNRPDRYLSNNMFSDNLCDINELAKKFTGTWQGDALQIFARNIEFLKKTKPLTFYHYLSS